MSQKVSVPSSWKGTRTLDQARQLIDFGVMLKWRDMRTLRRSFSEDDEAEVVRHFAVRLVERRAQRLSAEIIVESVLIWLANAASEKLLHAFLEALFNLPGCDEASWTLVEIALTAEVAENKHDSDIFEMAVALICELGISIMEYERAYPGEFDRAQALLDHVATYLLSVSNANSACIRLSLLHYFGVTEHYAPVKTSFNRIMGRFGHTVLDHLFALLFRKRSEAVALQYLLDNLPYVMEADRHSQKIVYETFKHYMLKQPERFTMFVQTFADELLNKKDGSYDESRKTYLQHLATMLKVASEVNHRQLARSFIGCILKFHGSPFCAELLAALALDPEIRPAFQDLIHQVREADSPEDGMEATVADFRNSKRGRKPTFSRAEGLATLHQVHYLGGIEIQKAS